jgi:hypothetical protein
MLNGPKCSRVTWPSAVRMRKIWSYFCIFHTMTCWTVFFLSLVRLSILSLSTGFWNLQLRINIFCKLISGLFWSVYCHVWGEICTFFSFHLTLVTWSCCLEPQKNFLSLFLPEALCRLSASTALRINSTYTYEMPPEKVQLAQIIPYNIVTPPPPHQSRDYLPRFIFMDLL